jgi:hypothetical protein
MNKIVLALMIMFSLSVGAIYLPLSSQENPKSDRSSAAKRKETACKRSRSVYQGSRQFQNLRKVARESTGDIYMVGELRYKFVVISPPPLPIQLNRMACDADAVVVGTIKSKASQLTEDETSIFTEHQMIVEEVLKDNAAAPIQKGSDIRVARIGGTLRLNNINITFLDKEFKPLTVGNRYLLFLQFLSDKNSYTASESQGSFLLVGNEAITLTGEQLTEALAREKNATSLIAGVRAAAGMPCDSDTEGSGK